MFLKHYCKWSFVWGPKPVATPARAPASNPPVKRSSLGGPHMVKSERIEALAKPPPPTSFTPVKSPEQKRPKAGAPAVGVPIRRSLCATLDAAGPASTTGPAGGDSVAPTLVDPSPGMSDKVLWPEICEIHVNSHSLAISIRNNPKKIYFQHPLDKINHLYLIPILLPLAPTKATPPATVSNTPGGDLVEIVSDMGRLRLTNQIQLVYDIC